MPLIDELHKDSSNAMGAETGQLCDIDSDGKQSAEREFQSLTVHGKKLD